MTKDHAIFFVVAVMFSFYFHPVYAQHKIYSDEIRSLQVVADNDCLGDPVIYTSGSSRLGVSFDYMGHTYRRLKYDVKRCEANWELSTDVFSNDYIDGFCNELSVENCVESINTNQLYTHCELTIPNEYCRIKLSGNYRVDIYDDAIGDTLLSARFMVADNDVAIQASLTNNTDIDVRKEHQQIDIALRYPNKFNVVNPEEQFLVYVVQNHCFDNIRRLPTPTSIRQGVIEWTHCRDLIFPAGNEYHKFEILDVHRNSMGVDNIVWDGETYNVSLYPDEVARNYVYDEDANGSFFLRNSDNYESSTTSEYVDVKFTLATPRLPYDVYLNGRWLKEPYMMDYDEELKAYSATLPLKYGYYSYQYFHYDDKSIAKAGGKKELTCVDNNFYQTENDYLILVYYKNIGDRTWRLAGSKSL